MTSFARALLVDVPAGDTKPRLAFALSDAGKATLTAGGLERGKTLALGALRWSDAISAAAVPAVVDAAVTGAARDRTTAVATLTHQCGASCFWYLALGNGFAFARALGMTNAAAAAPFLDGVGVPRSTVESAELAWTADDLLFVAAAGAGAPPAWRYAATAPAAAADACYRRALVRLRAVLVHDEHVQATWQAAVTDLAAGAGCIKSDASLAARHRAMTDLAAALMPAPAH
jgi:hypothetical protein